MGTQTGKTVTARDFFASMQSVLLDGSTVRLPVQGTSMTPFLTPERDSVQIGRAPETLHKGDIVIFRRSPAVYVMHRVWKAEELVFYAVGDRDTQVEGPIANDAVVAIVLSAERNGKTITPQSRCWKWFSGPWCRLRRFRKPLRNVYAIVARLSGQR